jgi:subtilase family serine protease
MHRYIRTFTLVTATLFIAGCGDDGQTIGETGEITATIVSVTPAAGFVPADIAFVGEVATLLEVDEELIEVFWDFGDGSSSAGSLIVSHLFEQVGDYTVTFTARQMDEANEVVAEDSITETVTIYPKADLRISTPFVGERAIRVKEDSLRVTFDLFNDASPVPVPMHIGVYLAPDRLLNHASPPDTDALADLVTAGRVFLIHDVELESFGGEGAQENFDIEDIRIGCDDPSPAGGIYEVLVFADDRGVVGEFDELNNIAFGAQTLSLINDCTDGPDLAVREVHAGPSRTNVLERVTVDFKLENQGNAPAFLFDYDIYLSFVNDILEPDIDLLLGSGSIENLPDGSSVRREGLIFELDEPPVNLGDYYVLVDVDPENVVEETNEANNVGSSNLIDLTDEIIPGTDLVVTAFSFDPLTTFLDGTVTLTATVLNQGTEATDRQFFCRVFLSTDDFLDPVDDPQLETMNFPSLGAGEEIIVERIARIPGFFQPGLYFMNLTCDPTQTIPEADDDNNDLWADDRLEISTDPEIDLRFEDFIVEPLLVQNGDDLSISMTICNDGTNGVGPSVIRIQLSDDPVLDIGDSVLVELDLDPLDADDCVEIVEQVPAICDTFQPNYHIFATLDATNLLPETNEENNQASMGSPLTIEGVFCLCEIDALEADNDSPATPTFVSARTYRNLSMCDLPVDWYAIHLDRGETVRAFITFDNERGNLDMILYGADRASILDESTTNGDREETVAFVVPETSDYLLKVCGRNEVTGNCGDDGGDVNVYDLTIEVSPPDEGIDLIVTNILLSETRPVLGESVDVEFDIVNLGMSPAGEMTIRAYISDDIEFDPGVDILLGELVLSDVPGAGKRRRTITVEMPTAGEGGERYMIVVADALNDVPGEIDETNNAGVSPVFELDSGCFDPLEPNNDIDDAYEVDLISAVTTLSGLLVCSDNRDFYRVCGDLGDFLLMKVQFDHRDGDVDLRLYNENDDLIQRAEGTGDEEAVEIDFLTADHCYTLEVLVIGRGREVPYELIIETGGACDECICSIAAEPNDAFASAVPLAEYLDPEAGVAVCPVIDEDFYYLTLSSGTRITISFLPASDDGDAEVPSGLRMALYNSGRNFLTNTVSATEPLVRTVTGTGRHYLRIYSEIGAERNQEYRLQIEGLDGIDLQPADLEVTPIASVGDRIQIAFTIQNNRELSTGRSFHYAVFLSEDPVLDPNEDILLTEVLEEALAGTSTRDATDRVVVPTGITTGVTQYLTVMVDRYDVVDEFEESNNVAIAPIFIRASCLPDDAEPNDLFVDWAPLESNLGVDLTICLGDVDVFQIATEAGTTYVIDAEFLSSDDGDLDLFVYDASRQLIAEAANPGDNEQIVFEGVEGDDIAFLEVSPFGTPQITYQLTITEE